MRVTSVKRLAIGSALGLALAFGLRGTALADDKGKPVSLPADPASEALTMAQSVEDSLVKAVAAVRESSVSVYNYQVPRGSQADATAAPVMVGGGSGVVFAAAGATYVITNEHVIKDNARIEVRTLAGASYEMALKDHVAQYDIALLEFLDTWKDVKPTEAKDRARDLKDRVKALKPARVGNSRHVSTANPGGLSEGQWVIATGNPFFLASDGQCVVTLGVVSGLDRILPGEFQYANAIQHDAEVNPGNSGGPLWTLKGELIGINGKIATRGDGASVGASNTGASFSVPIHLIQQYLPALMNDKVAAAAGYLGITCESCTDKGGQPAGAKVMRLATDSPCARRAASATDSGLVMGDVIQKISVLSGKTASYEIKTASDYTNALVLLLAGTKVRISYARGPKSYSWVGETVVGGGK